MGIEGDDASGASLNDSDGFWYDEDEVTSREAASPRTLAVVSGAGPAAEPEPSAVDLERGILDAMRLGAVDVARSLSARLEERRRASVGNVVDLDVHRRGAP